MEHFSGHLVAGLLKKIVKLYYIGETAFLHPWLKLLLDTFGILRVWRLFFDCVGGR